MTLITYHGDCRAILPTLPEKSVQCVVTSPPYYGLRRYGDDPREIGQEPIPDCLSWARRRITGVTPAVDEDGEPYYIPTYGKPEPPCGRCYVCALRSVFAGVWRVLRGDGVLFINLGDTYAANRGYQVPDNKHVDVGNSGAMHASEWGIPEKNLLGIPWHVALALQADGWILRNDNIWSKPNPMPESVQDRCTRSHEYVFMFAKQARYFYDGTAVAEDVAERTLDRNRQGRPRNIHKHFSGGIKHSDPGMSSHFGEVSGGSTRNRRTVWEIATHPYNGSGDCQACMATGIARAALLADWNKPETNRQFRTWAKAAPKCPACNGSGKEPGDHYAVFPEALVEPMIRAGSAAQACEHCGAAWRRVVERGAPSEESERPQTRRAAQLWSESGLTDDHLVAMRAVGMADAGKAQVTMTGYGKNTADTQRLANEAKAVLGGYYREFLFGGAASSTFAPACACPGNTGSAASVVLDPFAGSGTVLRVAERLGRNAVGIELSQDYIEEHIEKRTNGVQKEMFV